MNKKRSESPAIRECNVIKLRDSKFFMHHFTAPNAQPPIYYCAIWPGAIYQNVTPDYFRTYGTKLKPTLGSYAKFANARKQSFRALANLRRRYRSPHSVNCAMWDGGRQALKHRKEIAWGCGELPGRFSI
jgi:hypothetical protein